MSVQAAELKRGPKGSGGLYTVEVPEGFEREFLKAQGYVERYFQDERQDPCQGLIRYSGERYILVRAASMSKEFFDLVTSLYQDKGEEKARTVASGILFDMAHSIGKADAKSFSNRMGVTNPIEKLSAGPIHFAYTGWAFVKILPESHPTPDENYFLIYDHPFSFEAHTWINSGQKTDFPVCVMNAGYSSGWCEESFGLPLVAAEVECQAMGDKHCRFIMAPPEKIEGYVRQYSSRVRANASKRVRVDIPEFFQRKRMEDELKKHRDHLEELVRERTEELIAINRQLQKEINERTLAKKALQESETMLRAIFDQTFQFVAVLGLDGTVLKVNKTAMDFVGTEESKVRGRPFWETPWWSHSKTEQERLRKAVQKAGRGELVRFEVTHRSPEGRSMNVDFSLKPVRDKSGKIILLIAEGRDISELKLTMEDLKGREAELKSQSRRLEEANIALKVILRQMEEKKKEEHESILSNVKQLVLPYLERLKRSQLNEEQRILLEILENNLNHITSPLVSRLSSKFLNLTPMEIRVAHLVKDGLMNKEIADLLGISINTVISHRYKIRHKLGIKNKNINLRSYLLSLDE